MTFWKTSNIPHLSYNDTTIVSFTEENIVIRTQIFYVSPILNKYPKSDYEDETTVVRNEGPVSFLILRHDFMSEPSAFLRFWTCFVVISSVCFDAIGSVMLPFSMILVNETVSTTISSWENIESIDSYIDYRWYRERRAGNFDFEASQFPKPRKFRNQ